MAKRYLIRVRHSDGTWSIDTEATYTKREAENLCQFSRIMGGVSTQIWPYEEWMKNHDKKGHRLIVKLKTKDF